MALHFSREEFANRQRRARERMAAAGLDGLILFRQESMYYLTGYDTEGFVTFQGMYFGADGSLALLTRLPDLHQAKLTSVIEDVRVWRDREGASPAQELKDMLEGYRCRGKRLGVEYAAFGLTGQRALQVNAALDGFATLVDASDLVRVLRLVKSPAELAYVRRAGALAEAAQEVSTKKSVPGASIGAIYGEMLSVIMRGGGDPTANRWVVGAGTEALLGRYHAGLGTIAANDLVTWEFAASYRHYHAGLMHVALTGKVDPRLNGMFAASVDALAACEESLRPGRTVGDVYDTHARAYAKAGYGKLVLNACGYTMGATFPPTWMDSPMIHTGNPQVLEPNMVFFVIMVLVDREAGQTMSLAETAIVTEKACEPVCRAPRELIVH